MGTLSRRTAKPVATSLEFFDLRSAAIAEGKAALGRLMEKLKF
jgi:hypothetical protein